MLVCGILCFQLGFGARGTRGFLFLTKKGVESELSTDLSAAFVCVIGSAKISNMPDAE